MRPFGCTEEPSAGFQHCSRPTSTSKCPVVIAPDGNPEHGTTGEGPAERLTIERLQLQPVPTPYGGRSVRAVQSPKPVPIIGLQHPLSMYDVFAGSGQ